MRKSTRATALILTAMFSISLLPMSTLAEAESEKETLSDAGAYLVGADDASDAHLKQTPKSHE